MRGVLGIDESIRNGFQEIHVEYSIRGNADPETLEALVESSRAHSAVYDIITGHTPIRISVVAEQTKEPPVDPER